VYISERHRKNVIEYQSNDAGTSNLRKTFYRQYTASVSEVSVTILFAHRYVTETESWSTLQTRCQTLRSPFTGTAWTSGKRRGWTAFRTSRNVRSNRIKNFDTISKRRPPVPYSITLISVRMIDPLFNLRMRVT
jgi:hypothetical protein